MTQTAEVTVPYEVNFDIKVLQAENARLIAENAQLRTENEQFWQEQQFIDELLRVDHEILSASHKVSFIALYRDLPNHARDEQGWRQVKTHQLVKATGSSQSTVLSAFERGKRMGLLEKRKRRIDQGEGEYTTDFFLKDLSAFYTPLRYQVQNELIRNHGGQRKPRCVNCGSENLDRHEWQHCLDCNHDHFKPLFNAPPQNRQIANIDEPEEQHSQIVDSDEPSSNVRELENDSMSKLPTFPPLPPQCEHVANTGETSSQNPVTAPPVPFSVHNGFSTESWLKKRIEHGRIIYSTGILDQEKKYITKPEGYVPDIAAYLRGDLQHIYGSRPALPNGTTYLLGFDCDTPELDGQHQTWMMQLADAGISSAYWKRRPGRGHLEVYFDEPVDSKAAYAHLLSICPDLVVVPEVFPIGSDQNVDGSDRADFPYSWPFWYRIGNATHECEAEIMTPRDLLPMRSTGIESDRARLTWLLTSAINDASPIPALAPFEDVLQETPRPGGGVNGWGGEELPPREYTTDEAKIVAAQFCDTHTWEEILGDRLRGDRFLSLWHPEDSPSCVLNKDKRTASDYGKTLSGRVECHDKYDTWLRVNGIDKTTDLNERCRVYRERQRDRQAAS